MVSKSYENTSMKKYKKNNFSANIYALLYSYWGIVHFRETLGGLWGEIWK